MADDTTKKPIDDATSPSAETTLGKDSDLSINQPTGSDSLGAKTADAETMNVTKPTSEESVKPAEPAEPAEPVDTGDTAATDFTPPVSEPAAGATESAPLISADQAGVTPAASPDAKPVMVSEKEADAADGMAGKTGDATQELGEQVETLTGEIQALESKIEQLSGSSAPEAAAPTSPSLPSTPADLPPAAPAPTETTDTLPSETATKADKPLAETKVAKPEEKSAVATFSDIFAKSDKDKSPKSTEIKLTENVAPKPTSPAAADAGMVLPDAEPVSAAATIGEVLAFLGIFVLALLLVGPYFKGIIGDSLYSTFRAVGWLVAPASLLISFIVLLFAKGKALLKIAVFILLLVSLVFYFGVNTTGTISDQLNNVLGTIFSAYK